PARAPPAAPGAQAAQHRGAQHKREAGNPPSKRDLRKGPWSPRGRAPAEAGGRASYGRVDPTFVGKKTNRSSGSRPPSASRLRKPLPVPQEGVGVSPGRPNFFCAGPHWRVEFSLPGAL